jgi:hypothetical protein
VSCFSEPLVILGYELCRLALPVLLLECKVVSLIFFFLTLRKDASKRNDNDESKAASMKSGYEAPCLNKTRLCTWVVFQSS